LRAGDRTIDVGLSALDNECNAIYVCSQEPTDFTSSISTYALGNFTSTPGSLFTSPADAPGGRQASSVAFTNGAVTVNGTAAWWAAVDTVNLRFLASGPLASPIALQAGQLFGLTSFSVELFGTFNVSALTAAGFAAPYASCGTPSIVVVANLAKASLLDTVASVGNPVLSSSGGGATFNWSRIYGTTSIVVNGATYQKENDQNTTYALEQATNVASNGALGDVTRFEVHSGDVDPVTGSERSELDSGSYATIPNNTDYYVSYALLIEPGDPIWFGYPIVSGHFDWCIFGQSHKSAANSDIDWYIQYNDNNNVANTGHYTIFSENYTAGNLSSRITTTQYTSGIIPRGVWTDFFFHARKSSNGTSDILQAWINGVQVVNASGSLFTPGDGLSGNTYWKFGNYRGDPGNNKPVTACQWANMEYTTTDITARITSPKPHPVPVGGAAPVVTNANLNITLPVVNGQLVGTVTATNSPTSWSITAGNSAGYFTINNSGNITVTSAGASGLTAGSYSLTVQATNSYGSGTGTAAITVAAASAPVVTNANLNISLPVTNGEAVGTMVATGSPTSWSITAGNSAGYFAIDNSGNITVTATGASGLTAGSYSLTVQATNAAGSGSGTASITVAAAGTTYGMVRMNTPNNVRYSPTVKTIPQLDGVNTDYTAEGSASNYTMWSAGPNVAGSSGGGTFTAAMTPVSLDRFEVRAADQDPYTGAQRSEWDGGDRYRWPSPPGLLRTYQEGTSIWLSFAVCFLPSPIDGLLGITEGWQVVGQMHSTPIPPSVDIQPLFNFECETNYSGGMRGMMPQWRYANVNPLTSNSQATQVNPFEGGSFATRNAAGLEPFAIGQWHYFVVNMLLDHLGTNGGYLKIWHKTAGFNGGNALQIVNYTGPIGYGSAVDSGTYWKFGIYGGSGALSSGTAAIGWIANVELGNTDLTNRIANPLAVPPTNLLY